MLRLTRDLLTTALEGGSNFWYRIDGKQLPEGTVYADFKEGGRFQSPDPLYYYHPLTLVATTPGGHILVKDVEEGVSAELFPVGLGEFDFAWALMAEKHPRLYHRLVADMENADFDAGDGDIFFQLAVFGDVVYG